jgi:hypothetical protein
VSYELPVVIPIIHVLSILNAYSSCHGVGKKFFLATCIPSLAVKELAFARTHVLLLSIYHFLVSIVLYHEISTSTHCDSEYTSFIIPCILYVVENSVPAGDDAINS